MIHLEVFWVVTLYTDVVGLQHFGGPCCLHLRSEDGNGITVQFHILEDHDMNAN